MKICKITMYSGNISPRNVMQVSVWLRLWGFDPLKYSRTLIRRSRESLGLFGLQCLMIGDYSSTPKGSGTRMVSMCEYQFASGAWKRRLMRCNVDWVKAYRIWQSGWMSKMRYLSFLVNLFYFTKRVREPWPAFRIWVITNAGFKLY